MVCKLLTICVSQFAGARWQLTKRSLSVLGLLLAGTRSRSRDRGRDLASGTRPLPQAGDRQARWRPLAGAVMGGSVGPPPSPGAHHTDHGGCSRRPATSHLVNLRPQGGRSVCFSIAASARSEMPPGCGPTWPWGCQPAVTGWRRWALVGVGPELRRRPPGGREESRVRTDHHAGLLGGGGGRGRGPEEPRGFLGPRCPVLPHGRLTPCVPVIQGLRERETELPRQENQPRSPREQAEEGRLTGRRPAIRAAGVSYPGDGERGPLLGNPGPRCPHLYSGNDVPALPMPEAPSGASSSDGDQTGCHTPRARCAELSGAAESGRDPPEWRPLCTCSQFLSEVTSGGPGTSTRSQPSAKPGFGAEHGGLLRGWPIRPASGD